ncbi:MAG: hypothetical protein WC046_07915 [Candidatus Bathyarchaeia archaeon]
MREIESYQANWSWTRHTEDWLKSQIEKGQTVISFPCGMSKIGLRVDLDRKVKPDIIADIYHPPFKRYAVDVVISDPPFNMYGKGKKWFWVALADIARHKLILSTNLRRISGIKEGKKTIHMMTDSPNYMRCFQVFEFNRFGFPKKQKKLTEILAAIPSQESCV